MRAEARVHAGKLTDRQVAKAQHPGLYFATLPDGFFTAEEVVKFLRDLLQHLRGKVYTTCRHALGPGLPFDPGWRTSTAVALAEGVVKNRALDLMPVLADGLRDAGCGEEPLAHLTGECTLADWTLWNLLGLGDLPAN